jgi:CRISPR type III-A-associated RAMP protein Csm4
MQPAVLVRLRPSGPWRYGPGQGGSDRLDTLYRSDRVYSAVTIAMKQLGLVDEWLDATARSSNGPAVALGSLFPFQGETLFTIPPATLWPPPPGSVTTPSPVFLAKMRWGAARFVPLSLIESMLLGQSVLADQWIPDVESGCLLRRDRPSSSPFYNVLRGAAAVDRIDGCSRAVHNSACVEFEPGAGLWTAVVFRDDAAAEAWGERVRGCFRLLANTGFGGRRTSGWGHAGSPNFQAGQWPALLFPKLMRKLKPANGDQDGSYWLLSLFSPSDKDEVDWKAGDYKLTVRGGFVHANGQRKKAVRMISEGSVVQAQKQLVGRAVDVAENGAAHPVYRSGFALAFRLPLIESAPDTGPVEQPSEPEAFEPTPCSEKEEVVPEPERGDEV